LVYVCVWTIICGLDIRFVVHCESVTLPRSRSKVKVIGRSS